MNYTEEQLDKAVEIIVQGNAGGKSTERINTQLYINGFDFELTKEEIVRIVS